MSTLTGKYKQGQRAREDNFNRQLAYMWEQKLRNLTSEDILWKWGQLSIISSRLFRAWWDLVKLQILYQLWINDLQLITLVLSLTNILYINVSWTSHENLRTVKKKRKKLCYKLSIEQRNQDDLSRHKTRWQTEPVNLLNQWKTGLIGITHHYSDPDGFGDFQVEFQPDPEDTENHWHDDM